MSHHFLILQIMSLPSEIDHENLTKFHKARSDQNEPFLNKLRTKMTYKQPNKRIYLKECTAFRYK